MSPTLFAERRAARQQLCWVHDFPRMPERACSGFVVPWDRGPALPQRPLPRSQTARRVRRVCRVFRSLPRWGARLRFEARPPPVLGLGLVLCNPREFPENWEGIYQKSYESSGLAMVWVGAEPSRTASTLSSKKRLLRVSAWCNPLSP